MGLLTFCYCFPILPLTALNCLLSRPIGFLFLLVQALMFD
nr:MAG TPA: hypothetical protein [Caudoviricetes sp.]